MKRIIVCSDGTWNKPGNVEEGFVVRSNVQKIFSVIAKNDGDIQQIKHYDNGVAAIGSSLSEAVNGIIGIGLVENIINAYKFIIWNYVPGDEIYLFGFSRGAYTVRSLASMIRRCGILKNQDLNMIQEAYEFYRDPSPESKPGEPRSENFIAKNSFPDPEIKFLGVWDTVGALGIPHANFRVWNRRKFKFHDLTLSSIIKHAYHAMAVDEHRGLFDVNLWKQSKRAFENNVEQFVEQRWFSGVHSNVGGGYHEEQLSDIPLLWMIEKAKQAGLCIDMRMAVTNKNFPIFLSPSACGTMHNSMTSIHKFYPSIIRKISQNSGFNEKIDPSVLERMSSIDEYNPVNVVRGMERGIEVGEPVNQIAVTESDIRSYYEPSN